MRTQVNLLFYLKKRPTYKSSPVAIYLRFTVEGHRAEVSTGKTCDPDRWNVKAGRANSTKEDVRVLNTYLDTLMAKAQELHNIMSINNRQYRMLK